jgi:hypothetical protein
MALNVESIVDRGMKRKKSLCGSHALDTLRIALSFPSWLMRILGICAQPQRRRLPQCGSKLLRDGLIQEISARGARPFWRRDEDKGALALRITRRGLAAIGVAR